MIRFIISYLLWRTWLSPLILSLLMGPVEVVVETYRVCFKYTSHYYYKFSNHTTECTDQRPVSPSN